MFEYTPLAKFLQFELYLCLEVPLNVFFMFQSVSVI